MAATIPAHAAYESGGSDCPEGPSGRVCAHLEFDRSTGNIRARGAGDANAASGNVIVLDSTQLWQKVTERDNPRNTHAYKLDADDVDQVSPPGIARQLAGPKREVCDDPARIVEYKALVYYKVRYAGSTSPTYIADTGWSPGRC